MAVTSIFTAVSALVGVYAAYYFLSSLYCIFLHPLSSLPGPFFCRFSGWPSFYHTNKGDRHVWLWRMKQEYGPVIRIRYNTVIIATPQAFQQINDSHANVRKAYLFNVWPKESSASNTFAIIDKMEHARRRRMLTSALSDRALKSADPFITQHIDRWGEILASEQAAEFDKVDLSSTDGKKWGPARNMARWSDLLIFDIFSELLYGESVNTKEFGPNEYRVIPQTIQQYMFMLYRIKMSPFAEMWIWLKPRGLDALLKIATPPPMKSFTNFVATQVYKRLDEEEELERLVAEGKSAREKGRKDMLHHLFKNSKQGNITRREMLEDAELLTIAGSDTTAGSVSAAFFYLARYPLVYERLACEVRTTFSNLEDICMGPKLAGCGYLLAVVKETLRLSPSGSSDAQREVQAGGITVHGIFLPEGTRVSSAVWALGHDDNIYQDPFQFRPERWIISETVSREEVERAESGYTAFSTGIRGCPGKSLAYHKLHLTLARTLFQYDFRGLPGDRLGEGAPELGLGRTVRLQYQTRDALEPLRDGPMVQFRKRSI